MTALNPLELVGSFRRPLDENRQLFGSAWDGRDDYRERFADKRWLTATKSGQLHFEKGNAGQSIVVQASAPIEVLLGKEDVASEPIKPNRPDLTYQPNNLVAATKLYGNPEYHGAAM